VFLRLFERLFVLVLILYSLNVATALSYPYLAENDPVSIGEVHPPIAITQAALYVSAAILILTRWKRVLGAAQAVWPIMLLAALAPVSVAWSVLPGVTLRRSIVFVGWTLTAVYLGERYTMEKFGRLIAQAISIMMIASIAFYFVAPQYVLDPSHPGAWKGLSAHKNFFGAHMAILIILLLLIRFRQFPWLRFVLLAMASVMLFLSQSSTAIVVCGLVLAAGPLWRLARMKNSQRLPAYIVGGAMLLLAGYFLATNTTSLLQTLGRDSTLTGRTKLWPLLVEAIEKRPLFGYGYDIFFEGLKGESLNVVIKSGWFAPEAHNGFLELALSLGLVGLVVFVCLFVQSFSRAIKYTRFDTTPIGFWPVTFFSFISLHNITESDLLTRSGFSFLIFTAISTSLALAYRRRALARASEVISPARFAEPIQQFPTWVNSRANAG
jgi:exopolysaccharide production protein ExoQ